MRWIKRLFKTKERADKMANTATLERTNTIESNQARLELTSKPSPIIVSPSRSIEVIHKSKTMQRPIPESDLQKAEIELSKQAPSAPSLSEISCISKSRVEENRKTLQGMYAKRRK